MSNTSSVISGSFKSEFDETQRREVSTKILERYPGRVPVIVEKAPNSSVPDITKRKFLVPGDIPVGSFSFEIRKHLPELDPSKAIFLFVNDTIPPTGGLMSQLYDKYGDDDGFLYIVYSGDAVFGH
eukprot:TRINITY_DN10765_c0_g1_i1.p1 TRINITY_DN10765_c0_g1~~TRINITY_DN10765_c0_g1_i1.p1  ORF type:complete len:136 (-),score=37.06 TRINITY_DN10765_c0_g1_i1:40-417(-)